MNILFGVLPRYKTGRVLGSRKKEKKKKKNPPQSESPYSLWNQNTEHDLIDINKQRVSSLATNCNMNYHKVNNSSVNPKKIIGL